MPSLMLARLVISEEVKRTHVHMCTQIVHYISDQQATPAKLPVSYVIGSVGFASFNKIVLKNINNKLVLMGTLPVCSKPRSQ